MLKDGQHLRRYGQVTINTAMNDFNSGQFKVRMKKMAAEVNFHLYLNAFLSFKLFGVWKLAQICQIKALLTYYLLCCSSTTCSEKSPRGIFVKWVKWGRWWSEMWTLGVIRIRKLDITIHSVDLNCLIIIITVSQHLSGLSPFERLSLIILSNYSQCRSNVFLKAGMKGIV